MAAKKHEMVQEAGYFWGNTSLERFRIVAQFMVWVSIVYLHAQTVFANTNVIALYVG